MRVLGYWASSPGTRTRVARSREALSRPRMTHNSARIDVPYAGSDPNESDTSITQAQKLMHQRSIALAGALSVGLRSISARTRAAQTGGRARARAREEGRAVRQEGSGGRERYDREEKRER